MIKTLELFIDFIVAPKTAIEEIKNNNYLWAGMLAIFFAVLSQNAAGRLLFLNSGKQPAGIFIANFMLTFLAFIALIVLFSAWAHFLAGFFNAQANVKTLLSAITFCFIPLFLLLPLSSILLAWMPGPVIWYVLLILLVYTWIICLIFISIKNVYLLNAGQALLIISSPLIFSFLFLIMAVLSAATIIAGLFL